MRTWESSGKTNGGEAQVPPFLPIRLGPGGHDRVVGIIIRT